MTVGDRAESGQVVGRAADVYEEYFVPALFRQWPPIIAEAIQLRRGQRVLDVGCGTGVLARYAAECVQPGGSVVGIDVNEEMLKVAATQNGAVEWRLGNAVQLPFPDHTFDAVLSQFALMFVPDTTAAVAEMKRVAKEKGRIAIAVWDSLDKMPAYGAVHGLLSDLLGSGAAAALEPPFALGDTRELHRIGMAAGLAELRIVTHTGTARFPSIRSWMRTEVRGWTLADRIDDAQFEGLLSVAEEKLSHFRRSDGSVEFQVQAHILMA